jgi:hypothetical protein
MIRTEQINNKLEELREERRLLVDQLQYDSTDLLLEDLYNLNQSIEELESQLLRQAA